MGRGMRKLVWLAIGAGLAAMIAITAAILYPLQTDTVRNDFITKAEAIQAAKDKYPFLQDAQFEPKFGYLKHEGVSDMNNRTQPQISWYAADPDSSLITDMLHANVTLSLASKEMIAEQKDRYVWTVSYNIPVSNHIVFIDTASGKVLGEYVPCPACICYHYGSMYK